MSIKDEDGEFAGNTVRTSLFLGNGWMVSNAWRVFYVSAGLGAGWLGLHFEKRPALIVLPISLLAVSLTTRLLGSPSLPRSLRRLAVATMRLGVHAQMVALMTTLGIGAGLTATRLGIAPHLGGAVVDEEDVELVRAREAASDFPKRVPLVLQELAVIDGLIAKSNLNMADTRLRDIEGWMKLVLRSYAKDFADVADLRKQVEAMRERINTSRGALAINQASSQMEGVNRRLEQVDHELSRGRFDVASRLWLKAQKEIDHVSDESPLLAINIGEARGRLGQQREFIRRGFAHLPMPTTTTASVTTEATHGKKRNASKRNSARASRAVASDEP